MVDFFTGISSNLDMSKVCGPARNAARKWWSCSELLHSDLLEVVRSSGLEEFLKERLKHLVVELRYDDYFEADEANSYFEDKAKKIFRLCVHADGTGLAEPVSDEERYWPLKAAIVQAFIIAANKFNAPRDVKDRLENALSNCPKSAPWPALPRAALEIVREISLVKPSFQESVGEGEGMLWISFKHAPGEDVVRIYEGLKSLMAETGLGEWDGDSQGAGEADISFEVLNLRNAATVVADYLQREWPAIAFVISEGPVELR